MQKNGFTLIELLIGLALAMLCMNMMMMMFKQTSQVGLRSSQDAEYDTQIQIGLLVAQRHLQSAGYGSGQAADIAIGSFAGGDAVLWRFTPDITAPTTFQCQGIGEEISLENGRQVHRLMILKKTPCDTAQNIEDGTWAEDQVIVAIKTGSTTPIYSYDLIDSSVCNPYGIDAGGTTAKQQITLTAARQYMTGLGESIQNTLCLNNISAI